jgi:hypothetical protein
VIFPKAKYETKIRLNRNSSNQLKPRSGNWIDALKPVKHLPKTVPFGKQSKAGYSPTDEERYSHTS